MRDKGLLHTIRLGDMRSVCDEGFLHTFRLGDLRAVRDEGFLHTGVPFSQE